MSAKISEHKVIEIINNEGFLVVFPIKGKEDPISLWKRLFPRTGMRWEWDDDGDAKVFQLWHLMKKLSNCGEVVYSKWFQNRATFFSREIFQSMLAVLSQSYDLQKDLTNEAREILEILESDSPLSTKEIKNITGLKGRDLESIYNRSMRKLYRRGLIVSFGEKDDGAFPSSLMGATKLVFEDLWLEALEMNPVEAQKTLEAAFAKSPAFKRFCGNVEKDLSN